MAFQWPSKGQNDVLDYGIDWSQFLGSDVITGSSWTISPDGLTESSSSFTPKIATLWLSAGTPSQVYTCINTITTAAGATVQQAVNINILTV